MLIDAGVLIRFTVETDPDHFWIVARLNSLAEEGWELCFAPQAVRESWNVLTRPIANGGYGWTPERVERAIRIAQASFTLLEETPDIFSEWSRLAKNYGLVGKSVHDANVVATALAHGATHILTLNERDFRRYAEIQTLVP